jgi:hypothetical protein
MACLCDHTMQKVNNGNPSVFWCPRCGTIKTEGCVPEFEAPTIVKRLNDNQRFFPNDALVRQGLVDCLPKPGRQGSDVQFGPPTSSNQ